MYGIEVVSACGNLLGESVLWDDQRHELVWVDIHDKQLWRLALGDGLLASHPTPDRIGAIGLRRGGGLVAGFATCFGLIGADASDVQVLASVEDDSPTTRLNDGRVDRRGRFVCGGMDENAHQRPISGVYRLDPNGTVERVIPGVHCANSTCFSPEGDVMYFADMPTRRILAYRYDADRGVPHSPTVFADLGDQPGLPDGSTVDVDGCLWNAQWGGARVVRYTPDGKVDRVIQVPVTNPTCLAFGGVGLTTLFVTSARFGRTQQQLHSEPLAGHVFAVADAGAGLPEPALRG